MREGEPAYWDSVAQRVAREPGGFYDNWSKRRLLGQFLLKCSWAKQRILEIGVGCGATASLLGFSCGKKWEYIGTDVSAKFADVARGYGLDVIQTDVLNLPAGPFTRILALDSLEHVHPDDRDGGYKAIAERLAPGGLLFINMPLEDSLHEADFDHGIGVKDIVRLEDNGLRLQRYEHYKLVHAGTERGYAFVVMTKEDTK